MNSPKHYAVIVPVYRNRDSIPELVSRLEGVSTSLAGDFEAIFVVDGSPDDSADLLKGRLRESTLPARVIELSRNFGSFSAIQVGLGLTTADVCAVMAADLQEPPEMVAEFFSLLDSGDFDVVVGRRAARKDPLLTSLASSAFWWLYRRWINPQIPQGGVDVFACTREVAHRLAAFPEANTSLIGLLFWVGYRRGSVEYVRQPRHSGKSGWTLRKKLRYLTDSIYAFTDLPVIFLQALGLFGFLASVAIGLFVLVAWLLGFIPEPGYTPLMLVLTGSTSLILLALGVVASYVWRAYENSKGRPLALIARTEEFLR